MHHLQTLKQGSHKTIDRGVIVESEKLIRVLWLDFPDDVEVMRCMALLFKITSTFSFPYMKRIINNVTSS